MTNMQLLPSFEHPVHDAQSVFRALLKSMSEPGVHGSIKHLMPTELNASSKVSATQIYASTWSIALALFDHDTAIYLSPKISSDELVRSIQFQTGAVVTQAAGQSNFAIITLDELVDLQLFNGGSLEAPHESCTLIVQVAGFNEAASFEIQGPGIKGSRNISINGITDLHRQILSSNQQTYPCGLDFIFCSPEDFIALPRTTQFVTSSHLIGDAACM